MDPKYDGLELISEHEQIPVKSKDPFESLTPWEKICLKARAKNVLPKKIGSDLTPEGLVELTVPHDSLVSDSSSKLMFSKFFKKTNKSDEENKPLGQRSSWFEYREKMRKEIATEKRKIWDEFQRPSACNEEEELDDEEMNNEEELDELNAEHEPGDEDEMNYEELAREEAGDEESNCDVEEPNSDEDSDNRELEDEESNVDELDEESDHIEVEDESKSALANDEESKIEPSDDEELAREVLDDEESSKEASIHKNPKINDSSDEESMSEAPNDEESCGKILDEEASCTEALIHDCLKVNDSSEETNSDIGPTGDSEINASIDEDLREDQVVAELEKVENPDKLSIRTFGNRQMIDDSDED